MLLTFHLYNLARHHVYTCSHGHFIVSHFQFGRRAFSIAKLQYAIIKALMPSYLSASDFSRFRIYRYDCLRLATASRCSDSYQRLHGQRFVWHKSYILTLNEYSLGQICQCFHIQLFRLSDARGFGDKLQSSHTSLTYKRQNFKRSNFLITNTILYAPTLKHLVTPSVRQRVCKKRRQFAVKLSFPVTHDGTSAGR